MATPSSHLAFHGSIVLMFGVLLGAPYGRAINRSAPPQIVNSWRVAHQSLPMAAAVMLAVAACLNVLEASATLQWFVVGTFIASSYAFCVCMPLAAITGHRGLTADGKGLQRVVYVGNLVGALFSVAACAGLLVATGIHAVFG